MQHLVGVVLSFNSNMFESRVKNNHYEKLYFLWTSFFGPFCSFLANINPEFSLPLFFYQIYIINLMRRMDRRVRMLRTLDVLGIEVTLTDAVDGKYEITIWLKIVHMCNINCSI